MSSQALERHLRFLLDEQRVSGRLRIEPGYHSGTLSVEALMAFLDSKAVARARIDEGEVENLVEAAHQEPGEIHVGEVVKGTAPEHGEDARFQLTPELQERWDDISARAEQLRQRLRRNPRLAETFDPDANNEHGDSDDPDAEAIDFYNRPAFLVIRKGDFLGSVEPATLGTDGLDIFNNAIPAKNGRELASVLGRGLRQRNDSTIISAASGHLVCNDGEWRVEEQLEIHANVDFSTGNIDYPGCVSIREGVRDRFVVRCEKELEIRGLVEASTIDCVGELRLLGGMAGRERGTIHAHSTLHARYLDGTHCVVDQDLTVDREVRACHVRVGGKFQCPSCAVIGGQLIAANRVEVAQIGGEGGLETEIILGSLPDVESFIARAAAMCDQIEQRSATAKEGVANLATSGAQANDRAKAAERMTEFQFELSSCEQMLERLRGGLAQAESALSEHAEVNLTVRHTIYQGVTIRLPGWACTVAKPIKGPLLITLNENGKPVLASPPSADPTPLKESAPVHTDDGIPQPAVLRKRLDELTEQLAA